MASKEDWAWRFYKELGYRITDSKEDEVALNKTMIKIEQETTDKIVAFLEKTRDRYEKDYNIYKDSDSKIISNFIKEIIKQIKEGDYGKKV